MKQLHIFLYRHAPRVENTDYITDSGKHQARALGEILCQNSLEDPCKGMCSSFLRTRETLTEILAGAGLSGASVAQDAALQNASFDPAWVRGEITSADEAFNAYLQFGENRPQKQVHAPREVAADLTRLFYYHLTATSLATLLAVTHSGMIETLLAYFLNFRRVEEIGGCFDYLEGAHMLFSRKRDASLSMRVSFRGQVYTVDGGTLLSLLD